jgi:hypothetical protein
MLYRALYIYYAYIVYTLYAYFLEFKNLRQKYMHVICINRLKDIYVMHIIYQYMYRV